MAGREPALKSPVKAAAKPKPASARPVKPAPKLAASAPATLAATAIAAPPEPVIEATLDAPIIDASTPPAAAPPAAIIAKEVFVMDTTITNAAEKTETYFNAANSRAKTAMEKGAKMFEDMNEFGKGNIEALVESGKIAAKGIESLGQEAAEYSRKSFEGATAALKSLSSVKSPTDFFKLHSDYVRSSFDSMVAETSKSTEAVLKLAGEVAQPISNRVAVAVEKAKIAA